MQKIKLDILPLLKLIKKHFEPMQQKYKWGTNSYYYLAGKYGIHPTYIQERISQKLDNIQILEAIDQLKNGKGRKEEAIRVQKRRLEQSRKA